MYTNLICIRPLGNFIRKHCSKTIVRLHILSHRWRASGTFKDQQDFQETTLETS